MIPTRSTPLQAVFQGSTFLKLGKLRPMAHATLGTNYSDVHEEFSFAVSISCPKYPEHGEQPLPQIPTSVRVRNFKRTGGTFEALDFHIRFALCRLHRLNRIFYAIYAPN